MVIPGDGLFVLLNRRHDLDGRWLYIFRILHTDSGSMKHSFLSNYLYILFMFNEAMLFHGDAFCAAACEANS